MQSTEYLPYQIRVERAQSWMERPIKLIFSTPNPTGSATTAIYMDEDEARAVVHTLTDHLRLGAEEEARD